MSREEAIEIFKRLKENAPNEMHLETVGTAQELFEMAIQALSQESKTGHWIEKHKIIDYVRESTVRECSECGAMTLYQEKYCHKCGAKMVEPQESEG